MYLQVSYIEEMMKTRKEQFDSAVRNSLDQVSKDVEYAETAIKDMPKGRNAGQKANFTFIFRTDDEKRTYTLTTNESGNVSFTIIISPLKNGREVTGVDWIIENTNQQFCQTTTTIDKNGDVYLNGKRVTGIRKAKNVQINNGRVYVDGKLVKDND